MRDEKALAVLASFDRRPAPSAAGSSTTASGPSIGLSSSSGASDVERQFQASLEARAALMGLNPRQLLMLLTTSLDNPPSDGASSSDAASERAFSLVSIPPPAYD